MKSVISYPNRGHWGKNDWRGNMSGFVVKDLIEHFHPKLFVDACEGGENLEIISKDYLFLLTEKQKNSIIGELRGTSMKEQKRDIKKIMKKLDLAITSHNEKKQELLSKELNEKMKEFFTFLSKNAKVKIEVKGGVAEVTQCPDWIKTEVLDHDNY
ncbi:MAG: hypothetical protein ACMV1K_00260 [Sulfurospirillum sp.]